LDLGNRFEFLPNGLGRFAARYCGAMSQQTFEIVRDAFAAFNRGDLAAFEEYWTDDIDYRAAEGALDDHGPIQGRDALRAFMQDWLDMFDDFRATPVEVIDAGEDKVIAVVRISGRAKLSGVETDLTYAELWTFRDGKVAWGRQYWTRAEALEAAGLRE
jgi:ketosteroid isomerase-like protein